MQNKSIGYYLRAIIKRWYIVLILTVVCAGVGFFLGKKSYQPEYKASTDVLTYHPGSSSLKKVTIANVKGEKVTRYVAQRKADLEMMPTYQSLVTSDLILGGLVKKISIGNITTTSDLRSHVTVKAIDGTLAMTIEASATTAGDAVKIANSTATAYKENASSIMDVGQVEILKKATVNEVSQNANNSKKYMLLGIFVGLYLGSMIAILLNSQNKVNK
ncbi:Wzz/FepE/Etk N-terminal domain-containing protein [Loigolactobacillus coryniformis]|uniref:YveK family protein n=1 Tax=Loigolactobacillus coryniformis TaxID=1610 RepID=UPI00201A49CB|nr:Wzz/FepE/Etk N-terminal domain-containing protein [Loigolactobacillus coryniformis]MCL5457654.1 Wzz/FepE/Etk N-terminal domain-containing protein [Loigolactobacillus coryniformis]